VRLKPSLAGDTSAEQLARQVAGRAGVADVRYDRRWLTRLVGMVTSARIAGALVASVLMLGAAFTVGAVVRLSLYARRDELEIMQLVGAPFGYIRGPFVMEGLLLGVVGAVVALALLAALHATLVRTVGADVAGATGLQYVQFLGAREIATMLLGGLVVGALSGTVASRAVR
jgi:cell division transport system permease protein